MQRAPQQLQSMFSDTASHFCWPCITCNSGASLWVGMGAQDLSLGADLHLVVEGGSPTRTAANQLERNIW
jgi:hypothetical protein